MEFPLDFPIYKSAKKDAYETWYWKGHVEIEFVIK